MIVLTVFCYALKFCNFGRKCGTYTARYVIHQTLQNDFAINKSVIIHQSLVCLLLNNLLNDYVFKFCKTYSTQFFGMPVVNFGQAE